MVGFGGSRWSTCQASCARAAARLPAGGIRRRLCALATPGGRVDRQRGSWPGSANSVESKVTFADAPPTIGAGFARSNGWPLVDAREPWPRDNLQLISQKIKSRRGDPIHPASLAGPQPLRRTQRGSKRIYEIAETGTPLLHRCIHVLLRSGLRIASARPWLGPVARIIP